MPVQLTNRQRRFPVDAAALRIQAVRCLERLGVPRAELSVLLVNDRPMRALNRDYREKNHATDVLSFPMYAGTPEQIAVQLADQVADRVADRVNAPPAALGDVVISVETARKQAGEIGVTPAQELTMLLVHGLLHLLGYDHEPGGAQARQMAQAEVDLLTHLGLDAAGLVGRA